MFDYTLGVESGDTHITTILPFYRFVVSIIFTSMGPCRSSWVVSASSLNEMPRKIPKLNKNQSFFTS